MEGGVGALGGALNETLLSWVTSLHWEYIVNTVLLPHIWSDQTRHGPDQTRPAHSRSPDQIVVHATVNLCLPCKMHLIAVRYHTQLTHITTQPFISHPNILHHIKPFCFTPHHSTSHHTILHHVTPNNSTSHHTLPFKITSLHYSNIPPFYIIPQHSTSHPNIPHHTQSFYITSHPAILNHISPLHIQPTILHHTTAL